MFAIFRLFEERLIISWFGEAVGGGRCIRDDMGSLFLKSICGRPEHHGSHFLGSFGHQTPAARLGEGYGHTFCEVT